MNNKEDNGVKPTLGLVKRVIAYGPYRLSKHDPRGFWSIKRTDKKDLSPALTGIYTARDVAMDAIAKIEGGKSLGEWSVIWDRDDEAFKARERWQ